MKIKKYTPHKDSCCRVMKDPPIEIDDAVFLDNISEFRKEEKKTMKTIQQKRLSTPLLPLITDKETNMLYLSGLLKAKYPVFTRRLEHILREQQIKLEYLEDTRDIWCRDYMPVQLDRDNLMQFWCDPNYLRYKKYIGSKTTGTEVLPQNLPMADETDIILDGGNVISCGKKVIMTEIIFKDNKDRDHNGLLYELENIFRWPIIIIPRIPGDFSGHADGMVRYYDKDIVLVNDYSDLLSVKSKKIANRVLSILRETGFKCLTVPYFPNENTNYTSAYGCYINYLRIGDKVFLPLFDNKKQDDMSVQFFRELFKEVIPVPSREIAAQGGVLNCISWTINK
jgi:agmatine deiminase